MNNCYLIIGPPGSGKDTQADLLAESLNIPHISMGGMLREERAKGTNLGKAIASRIDNGLIVTQDLAKQVLHSKLSSFKPFTDFVFEGFPRTVEQYNFFEEFSNEFNFKIKQVFYLDVSESVIIDRLKTRMQKEERHDDKIELFKTRIAQFEENIKQIKQFYAARNLLTIINGEKSINQVFAAINSKITS